MFRTAHSARRLLAFACAPALAVITACSHGGGVASPALASAEVPQRVCAGRVVDVFGDGLAGVEVRAEGARGVTSDANGFFALVDAPPGTVTLRFDASAASGTGADFAQLVVPVASAVSGASEPSRPLVLFDLAGPAVASADVALDASGATLAPFTAAGSDARVRCAGPAGTRFTEGGAPLASSVRLRVCAVPAHELPHEPRTFEGSLALVACAFVAPEDAEFDAGAGAGLDLVLPAAREVAPGSTLALWRFDRASGSWFDLSAETGAFGLAVSGPGGTRVECAGLVTRGGWYAFAELAEVDCATQLRGRIVDQTGAGVAGALVVDSSGLSARSGADGTFAIDGVPAYDRTLLPLCVARATTVRVSAPALAGGARAELDVAAGAIVAGGSTFLGDLALVLASSGFVAGTATHNGAATEGVLALDGPGTRELAIGASGAFCAAELAPGDYRATFTPASGPARELALRVAAREVTTIAFQELRGAGERSLTVRVLVDDDASPATPPVRGAGAKVWLAGSDVISAAGLGGVCDAAGELVFDSVTGPFTLTAQLDSAAHGPFAPSTRLAVSVSALDPATDLVALPLRAPPAFELAPEDALLSGVIANLPELGPDEGLALHVRAHTRSSPFESLVPVDPRSGAFALAVPSGRVFDLALVRARCVPELPCEPAFARPVSAWLAFGVGPLEPRAELVHDFDCAAPGRVDFAHATDVTYAHLAAPDGEWSLALELDLGDGVVFALPLGAGGDGLPLPARLDLPDPAQPELASVRPALVLRASTQTGDGGFATQRVRHVLGAPAAALVLDCVSVPDVLTPAPEAVLTPEELTALTVAFTPRAGGPASGWNELSLVSGSSAGVALEFVHWVVIAPADATTIALPRASLPMFGAGAFVALDVVARRVPGPAFDFGTCFGPALTAQLARFDGELALADVSRFVLVR